MEQDVPRAALAVMEVEKIVAASFGEVAIYLYFKKSTASQSLLIHHVNVNEDKIPKIIYRVVSPIWTRCFNLGSEAFL